MLAHGHTCKGTLAEQAAQHALGKLVEPHDGCDDKLLDDLVAASGQNSTSAREIVADDNHDHVNYEECKGERDAARLEPDRGERCAECNRVSNQPCAWRRGETARTEMN
jgi:hypothetical protein